MAEGAQGRTLDEADGDERGAVTSQPSHEQSRGTDTRDSQDSPDSQADAAHEGARDGAHGGVQRARPLARQGNPRGNRQGEQLIERQGERAGKAGRLQQARVGLAGRDAASRITDATAELEGQLHVLSLVATGTPLSDVLRELCLLVEHLSPSDGMWCSVLVLKDGDTLRHGAAPSLPEAYVRAIDGIKIGPAVGSCGTSVYRRERVVVTDIAGDPLWKDYRDLALPLGLRACWSTPIFSTAGEVLGSFAIYYDRVAGPHPVDERLVDIAAHLAGVALEREQLREGERAAKQRYADLVQGVDAIVWEGDAVTYRPTFMSRRVEEVLGYPVSWWLSDPECWKKVVHPEDFEPAVRECTRAVSAGLDHQLEYRMVTAAGEVRWFRDLVRVVTDESGKPKHLRGVMVDITEQKEADAERRHAEAEHAERLRLDGAMLVVRTMAHQINNSLAPLVGFSELLSQRTAVMQDPQAMSFAKLLNEASDDLAQKVRRLQHIVRLEEDVETLGPDQPLLDVERSVRDGV